MVIFTEFLKEHNLYDEYMYNVQNSDLADINRNNVFDYIDKAFDWESTFEGSFVWAKLSSKWDYICNSIDIFEITFTDSPEPRIVEW